MEKLIAEKLSQFFGAEISFYQEQIGVQKLESTIHAAVLMIHKVHKICQNKQTASILLRDIKEELNFVSQAKLI